MITQDVIQLILTSVASTSRSFEMRNTFLAEEKAKVENEIWVKLMRDSRAVSCIGYS